jgi:predicted AlkP superfamily phosphohydrolase/phosphomutase
MEFSDECLDTFLEKQSQLFDEPVASNREEAEAFLEDCMAQILPNIKAVRKFLDESGMDVEGLSTDDLEEQSEIFPLPDGTYLVVEG